MKKILFVFMLTTLMSLSSCGARKVNKVDVSEKETVKKDSSYVKTDVIDLNSKTKVVTIENSKDSTIVETVEISPVDNQKPAYFYNNGKLESVTNAYYHKSKTIKRGIVSKSSNNVSELELNKKDTTYIKNNSVVAKSLDVKKTEIDREAFSLWWLLLLLIPVGLYFVYREVKDKVWWV